MTGVQTCALPISPNTKTQISASKISGQARSANGCPSSDSSMRIFALKHILIDIKNPLVYNRILAAAVSQSSVYSRSTSLSSPNLCRLIHRFRMGRRIEFVHSWHRFASIQFAPFLTPCPDGCRRLIALSGDGPVQPTEQGQRRSSV